MTSWPWYGTTIRIPRRVNSCRRKAPGRRARGIAGSRDLGMMCCVPSLTLPVIPDGRIAGSPQARPFGRRRPDSAPLAAGRCPRGRRRLCGSRHPALARAAGRQRGRSARSDHAPHARRHYATRWQPCRGARRGSGAPQVIHSLPPTAKPDSKPSVPASNPVTGDYPEVTVKRSADCMRRQRFRYSKAYTGSLWAGCE